MEAEPRNFGPTTLRPASNAVGVPLFHAAWLFALGVVIANFVWLRPAYLLIALVPVAILCGIAALRAQRIAWAPLAVLWCLLGAWCAEMQPQPAAAPALAALSDGLVRNVEGTIVDAGPVREEVEQDVRPALALPNASSTGASSTVILGEIPRLAGDLCSSRIPVGVAGMSSRKFCQLRPGKGSDWSCVDSDDCEVSEAAAVSIAVSCGSVPA